ncbi:MAG TPA: prolipoprotein diacylglyceryl transferase, partial [Devosia sp.]|nr:prolipoprotein diacylglyceryl transferase [Devosia sp.]
MPPLYVLPFPDIDPVAFSIGPLAVRWYALAYVFGLLLALAYAKRLVRRPELWGAAGPPVTPQQLDDFLLWATLGVVVGGRLGYVLFYNLPHYLSHPLAILEVWHGGMSFHGGFLGVIVASWLYSRHQGIRLDRLLDLAATGVPIGLGLGRLANFINGELYGRPTSVPWAMVFPNGGPEPRHPSQLYEALLEGLVLFIVIKIATDRYHALVRPGLVAGIFALGYGLARFFVEFFREPDAQIGPVIGFLTAGMLLSVPLM